MISDSWGDVEPSMVFAFDGEWSRECSPGCPWIVQQGPGVAASSSGLTPCRASPV